MPVGLMRLPDIQQHASVVARFARRLSGLNERLEMRIANATDRLHFEQNGYVLIPQVFSVDETVKYRDHYMKMRESGIVPGDTHIANPTTNDPLLRYPRMLQMHRWDDASLQWLLDPRLDQCLTRLLGREPYAVQTMIYFKPPGARGQALHQDNYYLRVQPGTCVAAWMALDACTTSNGCLQVVPGSHRSGIVEHHRSIGMHGSWAEVDASKAVDLAVPQHYREVASASGCRFWIRSPAD